jgi:hypothetical protein
MHLEYVTCLKCKKNLKEMIWTNLILEKTKLPIMLTEWKILMLQTPLIIVKGWIPYPKQNL